MERKLKKKAAFGVLAPLKKFRGGVPAMHQKNAAEVPLKIITIPEFVTIPMQQSIGTPCEPLVSVGEYVYCGQKIGDSKANISAPVHASISGTVKSIGEIKLANGNSCTGITIESDGKRMELPDLKAPVINSLDDFLDAIRESGLVGMGGAGFPTHAKLRSALLSEPKVDTLIINAAECEPYISVDNRECIEHPENILEGIKALIRWIDFKQVIIGVEDNKPKSFDILRGLIARENEKQNRIHVMSLHSRYPQGAEKMMIYVTTGRVVPAGKLPSDVGCVVMNVETCSVIGRYMKSGRPLLSRSITVDGDAINGPFNVRVPIGTSIEEIINFCGGFSAPPVKIILGGPMMGPALADIEAPICKNNNAILAFKSSAVSDKKEWDCIRCGRCVHACPLSLEPTKIRSYVIQRNTDKLREFQVMNCMECGSCAYHCPAALPLVQYMKLGKQLVREEGVKK